MTASHNVSSVMLHHEYCDTLDPIIRTKPCNCPPGWPRASAVEEVKPPIAIADIERRFSMRGYPVTVEIQLEEWRALCRYITALTRPEAK